MAHIAWNQVETYLVTNEFAGLGSVFLAECY